MAYSYETTYFENGVEIVPNFKIDGYNLPYIVDKFNNENFYSVRRFGFAIYTFSNINDAMQKLRELCETYAPANDKFADIYNDENDIND